MTRTRCRQNISAARTKCGGTMSFSEMMLPEFDQEMANTRKTLERVPEDKLAWKPHVKSTSLGGLATHLGNIPSWTKNTFEQDELDFAPPGAPPFRLEEAKSRSELLAAFDKNVADARAALESASDEKWRGPWSPLNGGNKIFTMAPPAGIGRLVMNPFILPRAPLAA